MGARYALWLHEGSRLVRSAKRNLGWASTDKDCEELGLVEYMDPKQDYILTRDLKSLSGAVLHKMVFVFRFAYIQAIQDKLGIKLPMILDSPSGREVEQVNVDDMMTILARDFSENQIIIASVFDYPIMGEVNRIEIGDRLIDQPTQYNEN